MNSNEVKFPAGRAGPRRQTLNKTLAAVYTAIVLATAVACSNSGNTGGVPEQIRTAATAVSTATTAGMAPATPTETPGTETTKEPAPTPAMEATPTPRVKTEPPPAPTDSGPDPRPAAGKPHAEAAPPADWTSAFVRNDRGNRAFSIMLPPGWEIRSIEGRDSIYGEMTGDGMTLQFDYRINTRRLEPGPGQIISMETINGRQAELIIMAGEQGQRPGITSMFLKDPDDDPETEDSMLMGGKYSTPVQQEKAAAIFRSIKIPAASEEPLPQTATPPAHGVPTPQNPVPTPQNPAATSPDARQQTLKAMYQLRWMKDGASPQERETADRIEALSRHNPDLALRVVAMPFLDSHDITDTGAVSALAHISWRDPAAADRLATQPSIAAGIEDAQAIRVALTHGEYLFGSNPARTLRAATLQWHTRHAALPISGNVAITVAAEDANSRAPTAATLIERDLAWLETYLGQPTPTANVLIHYGPTLRAPVKGTNVQTSIMQPGHHHNQADYRWLQHELTHYWFNSNEGWLDEGMAQILTSLLNSEGKPASLPATSPGCPQSARLRNLEPAGPEASVGSRCLYAVGERFMRTLYQEAGYKGFRAGAKNLAERANRPPFQGMGLEEVREAFGANPDAVRTAEDRWQ